MFNKEEYWKRRNNKVDVLDGEGKPKKDDKGKVIQEEKPLRGQGDKLKPKYLGMTENQEIGFDNQGQMVVKNRAYKRRAIKLPGSVKIVARKMAAHKKRQAYNKRRLAREEANV